MTPERTRMCNWVFCFNPASVFFSSIYTESIYALFSFVGVYYYERKHYIISALGFLVASGTRSNGCVNVIPVIANIGLIILQGRHRNIRSIISQILLIVSIVLPFIAWNYHVPSMLCELKDVSSRMMGWCELYYPLSKDRLYFVYGKLQQVHWNVGLLKQFQIRQIPNFLLASPTVICAFFYARKIFPIQVSSPMSDRDKFFTIYGLHLSGTLCLVILFAHVQIVTRIVYSSSPILYLHLAQSWAQCGVWGLHRQLVAWSCLYFLFYFFMGIVLHSNFYPWT